MSKRGVLISGYAVENWTDFGKLPSSEAKIAASRAAVEKLHPGKSKELEKPIYMSWGKVPYSLGSWVSRGPDVSCFPTMHLTFMAPTENSSFPTIGSTLPETTAVISLAGRKGRPWPPRGRSQ